MPEEGFSFFEIQTPPESCKFWKPPLFFRPKMATPPPHHFGGRSYGRLGLPFISATRKVRENTKK